jgi:hypothetical protein
VILDLSKEAIERRRSEWLRRLRSGEYKQGKSYLNRDGNMCCLGLVCEILADDGLLRREGEPHVYYHDGCKQFDRWLPPVAMKAMGMTDECGGWEGGLSLSLKNDSGMSFPQIADLIESNPPGLWVEEKP